jgi:hypothetical protein
MQRCLKASEAGMRKPPDSADLTIHMRMFVEVIYENCR